MTDIDPRLKEAVIEAHRETEVSTTSSWNQREAERFIAMAWAALPWLHDALRSLDQDQPHTVTSVTEYPIEDTSWLSQGVELNSEMLASIAISLKKLADYCGKPQPESEMERSHPCKGAGDCVGHPHDCYDHPHNCGCAKAAAREEVMPHSGLGQPAEHNATAPVMGAKLDAKFYGEIRKVKDNSVVPEDEYVVFLIKDNAFAAILPEYRTKCVELGCDTEQIQAIDRMIGRADAWRSAHPERLKNPDAAGEKLLDTPTIAAPVMGADPPWFKEQAETIMHDAHEACGVYHTTAKGQIIRALHRAFEYGKRFVSDQPPLPGRGLADPPCFRDCIAAAHRAWLNTGASNEIINWHAIVRAVLATANAQPPSSDRVMTALSVYLRHLGHYSTVIDPAGIEAMRAALIAAA